MPEPRVRVSWDEYFMNIAREVSSRSTCDRKFVGAVIVRANGGIARVVFGEFYRDPKIFDVAQRLGIELVDMSQGSAAREAGNREKPGGVH
jgi:deoxycytidylate deaminase